jgi:hypothetical protein
VKLLYILLVMGARHARRKHIYSNILWNIYIHTHTQKIEQLNKFIFWFWNKH